jgi:hypothetical protein
MQYATSSDESQVSGEPEKEAEERTQDPASYFHDDKGASLKLLHPTLCHIVTSSFETQKLVAHISYTAFMNPFYTSHSSTT